MLTELRALLSVTLLTVRLLIHATARRRYNYSRTALVMLALRKVSGVAELSRRMKLLQQH
jgi:hypothetical protein